MDYEKKYKEALERAKQFSEKPYLEDSKGIVEYIFPELAESEDERIKKNIIATIHLYYGEPLEEEAKEMIAWLEKQGEHAKFRNKIQIGDKVTRNEDGMLVNLSQLNRVAKKDEKQGEQKSVKVPKFKVGDKVYALRNRFECTIESIDETTYYGDTTNFDIKDQNNWELVEQKPAEWSEEDEWCLEQINFLIRNSYSVDDKVERLSNWVKSIKDRLLPQLKQEWSEDDEDNLTDIFVAIDNFHTTNHKKELITFLKSLKDRYTWKPSKEQMEALLSEVEAWTKGCPKQVILESLYNDLKKLKG